MAFCRLVQTNWDASLSKVPKKGDLRMFYRIWIWYDQLYIIDYGFVQNGEYRKMDQNGKFNGENADFHNWILKVISLVDMEIS